MAVEHLKICTHINPRHIYAYNNLAFIYNMHKYYKETIKACSNLKDLLPEGANHKCHRHWAFALFKVNEMSKAIKEIKLGISQDPYDADNWVVWGLILRSTGNYVQALHKFEHALNIDPDNRSAHFEM